MRQELLENEREMETAFFDNDHVYPMEHIRVEKRFYSVYELKRKYDNKKEQKVILDSDFQRNAVWKEYQKIELIESILMGLPIPIFYFNEDREGRIIVIDGRQRLTALFEYLDNKYALRDLKILSELNGRGFEELPSVMQVKLEDYQIQANVILPPSPDKVLFDIFERVNRTGTKLNKQEIRNALYQGNATQLLNRLEASEEFCLATGGALLSDKRMKGRYLLTRFLAFYLYFEHRIVNQDGSSYEYKKDMDELLGLAMDRLNSFKSSEIEKLEQVVIDALKKSYYYLGGDAYRRSVGGKRTPINMNLFETILYAMTQVPDMSAKRQTAVAQYVANMVDNPRFLDSIGNHRDNVNKVNIRFKMAGDIRKVLIE